MRWALSKESRAVLGLDGGCNLRLLNACIALDLVPIYTNKCYWHYCYGILLLYIYMEDIYITNVKVQSVYCIKDTYGTLMWKTHLIDSSYKGGIWNTRVEDSSRRLIWKTSLEDSFYKHYKGCIWNTHVEDSTGRLILKICLEDSF